MSKEKKTYFKKKAVFITTIARKLHFKNNLKHEKYFFPIPIKLETRLK